MNEIWKSLPGNPLKDAKKDVEYYRTNQGDSSPMCPDGRPNVAVVEGAKRPQGVGHARRKCSAREQDLMYGNEDVECDLLPGVSPAKSFVLVSLIFPGFYLAFIVVWISPGG